MPERECDVCVMGGGPAGAVAAFHLATLGHRVCLIESERFPRPHVGESLSPGVRALLDSVGLGNLVSRIGFRQPGETLLCWAEARPERIPAAAKSGGLLVDRSVFDYILLLAAQRAGVIVIQPATAKVARISRAWRIVVSDSSTPRILANSLIDASGRRSCISGRRISSSPSTVAIWVRLPRCNKDTTRVEAIETGWFWAAPVTQRETSLMFFCNPDSLRKCRGALELWLREHLAKTQLFAADAQTPFFGSPSVWNATCTYADEPISPAGVKVGEASFTLDPLSSTGVEKAMQSALTGAIVAHTVRQHPDRENLCFRYYRERQRETVAIHSAWCRNYYAKVERYARNPFWAARRGTVYQGSASPLRETTRMAPTFDARLQLAPDVSIAFEPCLIGNAIESRLGLRSRMLERPLVFLDGVEIAPLLADLRKIPTLSDLIAGWSRRISSARAERIVSWLCEKGIIGVVGPDHDCTPRKSPDEQV